MSTASQPPVNHSRQLTLLVLAVVGMFGFGFALVPLYDVFCEITGLNGKTNSEAVAEISAESPRASNGSSSRRSAG